MDCTVIKRNYPPDNHQIIQYGTRWMRSLIPLDWGHKKLYEIAKFRQGLQIAKIERFAEPAKNRMRLIKVMDFHSERNSDEYITTPSPSKKSVICHKDDILIARTGTLGLVLTNVEGVFHNNTFAVDYDRQIFDKDYFCYFLKSAGVQLFIRIISTRTTQSDLTHKEFSELVVFIPPLTEQQKIASIISRVDELIQKTDQIIEQTQRLKKGLMQRLLTEGIGYMEFKEVKRFSDLYGKIPFDWDIAEFNELIDDIRYGTSVKCTSESTGIPILRIPNVINGTIDFQDLKYAKLSEEDIERYKLRNGDMLFIRTNGNREYVGRSAIFDENTRAYAFAS